MTTGWASTIRTEKLRRLKASLGDSEVEDMMSELGLRVIREMSKNVTQQGIWDKWRPFSPNTAIKRAYSGKTNTPFGGFINRFKYTLGKASVKIIIDSKYAKMHDMGNEAGWSIPRVPKTKGWIVFPTVHGMKYAKQVRHPGFPSRQLMPPIWRMKEIYAQLVKERVG